MSKNTEKQEVIWKDRKHHLWFPLSFTKYSYANNRIYTERGLLRTHYDEVLLYRVIDISLDRTLGQKLCGTGTIKLTVRGESSPVTKLVNIKNSNKVRDMLSADIEKIRKEYDVVGTELYGANGLPPMHKKD